MTNLRSIYRPLLALLLAAALAGPAAGAGDEEAARRTEAEVAFTYGLAAFNGGDDEKAQRLFEQAVADDPGHAAAHYFLGLVRLRRGDTAGAAAAFEAALEAPRETWVERAEIERRLRATGGPGAVALPVYGGELVVEPASPRFEGRLGAAFGSDSNPALLPADTPGLGPGGAVLAGEESDTVTHLDLRLAAYPWAGAGGWSLGLVAEGRQSLFGDLGTFDLTAGRAVAALARGSDPSGYLVGPLGYTRVPRAGAGSGRFALLVQGGVAYRWLDGESFVRSDEAAVALTVREGVRGATQLDLELHDDRFFLQPQADGERLAARLSQYLYLGARNRYLRLFVAAGERDAGPAFDSSTVEGGGELALPLGRRAILYLVAARAEEDFDNVESNPFFPLFLADAPRQDTSTRGAAAVSVTLAERLLLTGRVSYLERQVDPGTAFDLIDLDAERTVATLGVSWFF